jgi:hypothetical protein
VRLPGLLDAISGNKVALEDIPTLREELHQQAQLAMDFTAADNKRRYDSKHKPVEFKKGDKVYLRLYHRYHLPSKPARKLSQ